MTAPKPRTKHPLWELTRGQRLRYSAAVLMTGLAALALFGVPMISRGAIDGVLRVDADQSLGALGTWLGSFETPRAALTAAGALLVLLTLLASAFHYLRGRWAALASESIVRKLRVRMFEHLGQLPSNYHDRADTGDLVQRCSSDIETVRLFLSVQVVEIGRTVLSVLILAPILFALDASMAWVAFSLMPLISLSSALFFRRIQPLFRAMDEAEGAMTAQLQENLTGIRVVRAFARQDYECEKFAVKNAAFRDSNLRLVRVLGTFWSTSDFLCFSQLALILFAGANAVFSGELSVGTLFVFLACAWMVIWPIRQLGRVLADSGKAVVALRRLDEVLSEPAEPAPAAPLTPTVRGDIRFENVTFAYGAEPDAPPALRGFDLHIAPGETVALMGPPGSGKSTVIALLLRLYDYQHGSIRLDGHELNQIERRHLRKSCGVVLQEPFLFSRTIGENLRLTNGDATGTDVASAVADADLQNAIADFPDGQETRVGERGVTLSGGQRQRVAIARALLAEAPILILDDALSAVDTRTEGRILDALRSRTRDKTTLIVAHRISTVRHADRIVVLDAGTVSESGTHRELLARGGQYRRLWELQSDLEAQLESDAAVAASNSR